MKSRIINTKHLVIKGNVLIGYTSELKPSLFYFDRPEEARRELYIQFMDRENKMVKFEYVKTEGDRLVEHTDIFMPTKRFREKYKWCRDMEFHVVYDKANLFGDSNRPVHRKKSYRFKKGAINRD